MISITGTVSGKITNDQGETIESYNSHISPDSRSIAYASASSIFRLDSVRADATFTEKYGSSSASAEVTVYFKPKFSGQGPMINISVASSGGDKSSGCIKDTETDVPILSASETDQPDPIIYKDWVMDRQYSFTAKAKAFATLDRLSEAHSQVSMTGIPL